jgi:pectate lyase
MVVVAFFMVVVARPSLSIAKANSDQFDAEFVGWAKSPAMLVNGGLGGAVKLAQTA